MRLLEYLKRLTKSAEAAGLETRTISVNRLKQVTEYMDKRQWIKDSFPENEKDVLIIVEHRLPNKPPHRRVIRAFYEDGLMPRGQSEFFWEDLGEGPVPAGWYETTDYGENYEISDPVIGWQPLPDPWEMET